MAEEVKTTKLESTTSGGLKPIGQNIENPMPKHPGGRPLKFKSLKELEVKIQAYFDSCFEYHWKDEYYRDEDGNKEKDETTGKYVKTPVKIREQIRPFTITGLAVALDTTRETLLDYEDREEYSDTIKKAKQIIHNFTEEKLFGNNATGVIFNLKNNYDWKDKSALELSDPNGNALPPIQIEIVRPKNANTNPAEKHPVDNSIRKEPAKPEANKG